MPQSLRLSVIFLCFVFFLTFSNIVIADSEDSATTEEKSTPSKAKEEPAKKTKEEPKPEFPSLESIVKDMEKIPGFYTLYRKKEKEMLYALIPTDKFREKFLIAISISRGPFFAGFQWEDWVVQWERVDKQLLLLRPNLLHKAKPKTPIEDVVHRSFTSSVIASLPIMSVGDGGVLIDLALLFKRDLGQVGRVLPFILGGSYSLSDQLSRWSKVKNFPLNIEIEVEASFSGGGRGAYMGGIRSLGMTADSRGVIMGIHYSISSIPNNDYKPRMADDRIGYFTTAIKDYNTSYDARNNFERYINRWDLTKADPKLDVSPPKKPIVFYIEKTVPYNFRRYVHDGILEWNKAFEKIGIVGAIEVRQQTDTNEFANFDPEDIRYNFFRWITTDYGFAMGPSRVNPMTGEILDADIVFDDGVIRYALMEQGLLSTHTAITQCFDPKLGSFLDKYPEWTPKALKRLRKDPENLALDKFLSILAGKGKHICQCSLGKLHQLSLAKIALEAKGKKLDEEIIGETVKEMVMHEVGHTLGLEHNFKASSWLKLSEINKKEKPSATVGSVMDYNPANYTPSTVPQGHYLPQTLGPYDFWAIEYGYTQASSEEEDKYLKKITDRVAEEGLVFATDDDSTILDPDPLATQFDLGNDLIEYSKLRMDLVKELQKDLLKKSVNDGESYLYARKAFNTLLFEYGYNAFKAARYVSGQYFSRDHKGDPNARPPFVVVPVEKQRETLKFLSDNMFSDASFIFSPELLNHLSPGRWGHWGSREYNLWLEYPVHEMILAWQDICLFMLINPFTLTRLHDGELQVPSDKDAMTVPELLGTLNKAIWSELKRSVDDKTKFSNRAPFISSIRRNLQRAYLDWMLLIVRIDNTGFIPADVQSVARKMLKALADEIKEFKKKVKDLDDYSEAHLTDILERIDRVLNPHDKGMQSSSSGS